MSQAATTIYVPRDTTTISLGADQVADMIQTSAANEQQLVNVVRNGSRGLYWLEPMLEIDTDRGRVAYGPVMPDDVDNFLASECWREQAGHPLYLGLTEDLPFLKNQQRLTFSKVGLIDPLSVDEYCHLGGFEGLRCALKLSPQETVSQVTDSGLRGRGGAAFPTGKKWQTVLDTRAEQKYIVCNADEGDAGTYADRMMMESDPFALIEGMTIAALAVGASIGYIYLREEYRLSEEVLNAAIRLASEHHFLGDNILDSDKSFSIEVRLGAGAYICGEETALLESLEGKRGMVRAKPPLPAIQGLWQQPTVINNVITLATIPAILAKGSDFYRNFGIGGSRGTMPFQLSGNIKQAGLVELAFGPPLATLLNEFGGGTANGRAMKAVQVGGPLGAYLPSTLWHTLLDYEAFATVQAGIGHGGIIAFDDSVDMSEQARFAMEFCAIESCGKCTPCRIGSVRGVEVIDQLGRRDVEFEPEDPERQAQKVLLEDLCETMTLGSLCGLGGMTAFPVLSALKHFSEDFD